MNYFGTSLTDHGHYFWEVGQDGLYNSSLDFKYGFDPQTLGKGHNLDKGDTLYKKENGYSIYYIEGSCKDDRHGTKSVFFEKGIFSPQQLKEKILSIPICKRIIEAMKFKVNW